MVEHEAGFFAFFLIILLFGLGLTVFWVWALVDAAMNEPSDGNEKLIWILIIVLAGWIGALIYVLVRRPQRLQHFSR